MEYVDTAIVLMTLFGAWLVSILIGWAFALFPIALVAVPIWLIRRKGRAPTGTSAARVPSEDPEPNEDRLTALRHNAKEDPNIVWFR